MNFGPMKPGVIPHFNGYFPMGIAAAQSLPSLSMTLQLLFRVETNLKLNIVHTESQERYLNDEWKLKKNEVHFLLMEGLLGKVESQSLFGQVSQIKDLLKDDPDR